MSGQSEFGKLMAGKLKSAVLAVKDKPIDHGLSSLRMPAGVVMGTARITKAGFAQYKDKDKDGKENKLAGKWYFRAVGSAETPTDITDPVTGQKLRVKGLSTSIMIPLYDNPKGDYGKPKSIEQYVAELINEFGKLGLPVSNIEEENVEVQLAEYAKLLEEMKPRFYFSTKQPKSYVDKKTKHLPEDQWKWVTPDIQHIWYGCQELDQSDNPVENVTTVKSSGHDLDKLLAAVTAVPPDEAAIEAVTKLAISKGATEQQVTDASDWKTVISFIKTGAAIQYVEGTVSASKVTNHTPSTNGDGWKVEKGTVGLYTLDDGKQVQVKVESITPSGRINLVDHVTGKTLICPKKKSPVGAVDKSMLHPAF